MQSRGKKDIFYYQADASSLGGLLEKPFEALIPAQASVALPATGGFATTRTEAFNLENLVSCSAAYARVAGRYVAESDSYSVLVTSVVEGLNILEIVTADKVVAQVSMEYPSQGGARRFSFAGSQFENLRIGGVEAHPDFRGSLLQPSADGDCRQSHVTADVIAHVGREQLRDLVELTGGDRPTECGKWIREHYGWMEEKNTEPKRGALCSLVSRVASKVPGRPYAHIVEIPDFGRIYLAEFFVSPQSFQLTMIRADLGCTVHGRIGVSTNSGGGHTVPPVASS